MAGSTSHVILTYWVAILALSFVPASATVQTTSPSLITWATAEEREVKVCEGQRAELSWEFVTRATVREKSWMVILDSLRTMASEFQGFFETKGPYTDRIQRVSNTTLSLSNVSRADSGRYGLTVNMDDGRHATQWLYLTVMSAPKARSKGVKVTYEASGEKESACFTLVCGTLVDPGSPPVKFEWETPGANSSSMEDEKEGKLRVTSNCRDGRYTCSLAGESLACLDSTSPLREPVTFVVGGAEKEYGQQFPSWAFPVIIVLCVCIALLIVVGCFIFVKFTRNSADKRGGDALNGPEEGIQCELSDT